MEMQRPLKFVSGVLDVGIDLSVDSKICFRVTSRLAAIDPKLLHQLGGVFADIDKAEYVVAVPAVDSFLQRLTAPVNSPHRA